MSATKQAQRPKRLRNQFLAIIKRDEDWYVAYCPEVPGANGQGKTPVSARKSLAGAIKLILDDRRLAVPNIDG